MQTTTPTTGTLTVAGARLHYEVRGSGPLVALIGSPMGAEAFAPLAELLARDHTVLTTDPRGSGRSPLDDPAAGSTPEARADDLAALLTHLDAGPAAVLGSSGGAVTALALAQRGPHLLSTVVAHEPPLVELLEDREAARAGVLDVARTFTTSGATAAWRAFLANADIQLPEEVFEQVFGGERDASRMAEEKHFFEREMVATTLWQPDLVALSTGPVRVVPAAGEASGGQLAARTSVALGTALGVDLVLFPGDHTGFVDVPDAFAIRLRDVLEGASAGPNG